MNEKISFFAIISILFCVLFTGCGTTDSITSTESIAATERSMGKLESTAETIGTIIDSSSNRVEDCITRSREMEDTMDRIEYLFNCYDTEYRRIIDELTRERDSLKDYIKNNVDSNSNSSSNDNSENSDNATKN